MALPVRAESEPPVMLTSLPPPAVLSLVATFPVAEGEAVPVTLGQQEAVAPEGAPQKLNFPPTPSRVYAWRKKFRRPATRVLCTRRGSGQRCSTAARAQVKVTAGEGRWTQKGWNRSVQTGARVRMRLRRAREASLFSSSTCLLEHPKAHYLSWLPC